MRNFLLLLAVVLGLSTTAFSQTDISIGTGTTGNTGTGFPAPLQDWYEGSRAQYLFRASELTAAGMSPGVITTLKLNVVDLNTFSGTIQEMQIKIGSTTSAALTNVWETTTPVFGPVDYTPTLGVNTFTFSTPFFWNGTDNIVIEVCNGLPANTADGQIHYTNNVTVPWTTNLGFNASHTYRVDNGGNLCSQADVADNSLGQQSNRPNMTFTWIPAAACAGTPNAGTATANPSNVCLNQNITLNATGVTVASGLAYQWQVSSTPGGPYTDLAGATTLNATTTQTTTSYYILRVTCTNDNTFAFSNEVTVTSPPAPGGTYTIGGGPTTWNIPAGVGNASGTNFATFQEAIDAMSCGILNGGVVFNVVNATYTEQLIIPYIPNSSAANTVTFNGNGATIQFATTAAQRAVVKLNGADYIRFDNFNINPTGASNGYGFHIVNNADSNIISNNTININATSTATSFAGVVISGSQTDAIGTGTTTALNDGNEIRNNTINGGHYGITLTATFAGGANGFNKIVGNTVKDFYSYGIYVAGSYNSLIDSNYINRPTRANTATTVQGIYFTAQSNTAVVSRNRITNPFGATTGTQTFYGIDFSNATASSGNDNIVRNNLIAEITGNGTIHAINNSSSGNVSYFHNTISLDNPAATSGTTRGFSQSGTASGLAFYNNMISITRGGTGQKHAIYLGTALLQAVDYNNYYVNATNGHVGFFGGNRTTLADWQTATAAGFHDVNSVDQNPVFSNPAAGDYCIGNAGIDNKGLYVGIDFDIKGSVRDFNTPDIGAFECTPPPCTIPPVTGATMVDPTTVCQGLPVLLNLNIGAYGSGQTFEWESSPNNAAPWTSVSPSLLSPNYTLTASSTMWLRAKVTCGAAVEYSTPVLLTVDPAFPGAFYTINKNLATDYYTGGFNFNSFNDAYTAMAACGILDDVVFDVVAGTGPYNEKLVMNSIRGVSETATITFNGNNNIITFGAAAPHLPTSTDRAVIKLSGLDHTTFNDLVIDASNGTSWGYGVQLHDDADSNTFRNCTIITSVTSPSNAFSGVVINANDAGPVSIGNTLCDGNTFVNNTITGGYYGVTLVGGNTAAQAINNNKFMSNTVQEFFSTGFYIAGTNNTVIDSNTITRPTRASFTATTGIFSTVAANNGLRISRNSIRNLTGGNPLSTVQQYGIYHNVDIESSAPSIVSNNLISDLGGNGLIYALYNVGSENVHYYHNTISIDSTTSTSNFATRGYYQQSVSTGLEFKNNIITIKRGGAGPKHAVYFDNTGVDVVSDYNDLYVDATNAHVGFWQGNQTTLADWQTASGEDANSISEDPLYRNPAIQDYRPSIQTVDDKGTNATSVPISDDIKGVTRSITTPDMGAFEFAAIACSNPPTPGIASVTPASNICLEEPISLNITGHSPLGTLTFQWFSGPTSIGPWTAISPVQYGPQFDTLTGMDTWYVAELICGSGTPVRTTPIQVVLNPIVLEGTHTIDPSLPTSPAPWVPGSNFNSFTDAVNAMSCGIGGRVVFNVASATYNEQIRIGNIRNTNATNTVTFQSQTGDADDVILTYGSTLAANNYTLNLDSSKYFRFYNMTIAATDPVFGRAVEFSGTASFDSLANCKIIAPAVTTPSNVGAAIYASALKGTNNVIKGNQITNGAMGIYWFGQNGNNPTYDHQLDSNTITGAYMYGIQTNFQRNIVVRKNTVNVSAPLSATSYGIFVADSDSTYDVLNNTVNINNATTNVYAFYLNNNDRAVNGRALIHGNTVKAETGNTGSIWGMYLNNSGAATSHHEVLNNVISINTTGITAYGIYSNNVSNGKYYNNTVNNTSPNGTVTNVAARFENPSAVNVDVRNNIFSHKGGGRALYVQNSNDVQTFNYNMLYTSGTVLVQRSNPAGSYATLDEWTTASSNDRWSIVYEPAFVSNTDLQPNLTNPDVWAMHGRGTQITGNSFDFNGNYRPQTLTEGVPDLGAYEFFPTAQPTILTATPAAPGPNVTQTFMYGTDTVMKITWGATNFPPSITAQRFSGVEPGDRPYPNTTDSMFFYVKTNVGAVPNNYDYSTELFYLDPWQGSIPDQFMIGLGRRSGDGSAWIVGFSSRVNTIAKKIDQPNIAGNLDRFTGFINPYAPPVLPDKDSSNRGRRFWVAYAQNQLNGGQDMVLYLSAQQQANVQVKINGTTWVRNYVVPAGTVTVTEELPKAGFQSAYLSTAGVHDQGISIVSDVPIVAYAHCYGSASSGAVMLLPVGVWGYEYRTLGITQNYGANSFSYFYVIADNDNTVVEVTPSVAVQNAGMTAGGISTVTLNKGQVLQVIASSQTSDLTGSTAKSVPNSDGKCFPIATFSGSTRTAIDDPCAGGGDFMMQQNFPATAWGKEYLTAPTSASTAANNLQGNIYRVAVKDLTAVITVNSTPITAAPFNAVLNNAGYYYEFESNTPNYIVSDKPIMVAQYLSGACTGVGDPEMIYISPIEQGINEVSFYRNTQQAITTNYVTLIVPDAGLASLEVRDANVVQTPDHTYAHTGLPGYTVWIKRWTSAQRQVTVTCDLPFTGITYGLGSVESYGYNVGTLVKNIQALGQIDNPLGAAPSNDYTCANTPFNWTAFLPVIPTSLTWKFSGVPGLSPANDVVLTAPTPTGTTIINGTTYYEFALTGNYMFNTTGLFPVVVEYEHPDIESCDNKGSDIIYVQVVPSPKANFAIAFSGCEGDNAAFTADLQTANGVNISSWDWTFPDASTATGQTSNFTFTTAGTYGVNLHTLTPDGCIGDSLKQVVVNPRPSVAVVTDLITVCPGDDATFNIQTPLAGATYNWYTTATGGTPITTGAGFTISADGTSFTVVNATATATYYVEGVSADGCNSTARQAVQVQFLPPLPAPVVTVTDATSNTITFSWAAITGAAGYQVSLDGGNNWVNPSSGATGLTHIVSGLAPATEQCIMVRVLGTNVCQNNQSASVCGRTRPDAIFIPNTFTPNNDGKNDVLVAYGWAIQSIQFMVFNQWGEKIHEINSNTQDATGGFMVWDGRYKGTIQPVGVYAYVARITLKDGTVTERSGALNIVR